MKKQLLATLVAGSILTTGAFAFGGGGCDMQNPQQCMQKDMMGKGMHKGMRRGHRGGFAEMGIIRELNLTSDQRTKIQKMRDEMRKNRVHLSDAFSNGSFDQTKYENLLKAQRDNRIKNRAKMLGQVYDVLSAKQKAQFKTLLELHEDRMDNPPKRGKRNMISPLD